MAASEAEKKRKKPHLIILIATSFYLACLLYVHELDSDEILMNISLGLLFLMVVWVHYRHIETGSSMKTRIFVA